MMSNRLLSEYIYHDVCFCKKKKKNPWSTPISLPCCRTPLSELVILPNLGILWSSSSGSKQVSIDLFYICLQCLLFHLLIFMSVYVSPSLCLSKLQSAFSVSFQPLSACMTCNTENCSIISIKKFFTSFASAVCKFTLTSPYQQSLERKSKIFKSPGLI